MINKFWNNFNIVTKDHFYHNGGSIENRRTVVEALVCNFDNDHIDKQNYPNPFNPSSKIRYTLPFSSNVKIEVYNILGGKVKELINEQKNAGYYEVNFNTNRLASGVYFYLIYAKSTDGKSEFRDTKKMVLLK